MIKSVSNRIQEISTIDLNHDDLSDPILVVPENFSEAGEYFQLSIRVPDPAEVTQLPSSTDQEAWKKIATEQSIEVLTTSVVREGKDQMTVQSTPSSQFYPQSVGAPYYQHHFGLGEVLLTSMLVHSLFTPPLLSLWLWLSSDDVGGKHRPIAWKLHGRTLSSQCLRSTDF